MSEVASASHVVEPAETPLTPESWGKLGMWIFLAGDAMSFGTLLAGYALLRGSSENWPVPMEVLGINLTAFMTFLLIVSSVTMVKGLEAIKNGDNKGLVKFLSYTILGGAIFLGLQAYEWTHLIQSGLYIAENPHGDALFGATFYAITGFHGLHVTGGVIYLCFIAYRAKAGKYSSTNWNEVEIVGLYWHFVDLVWILVFTFIYLL
ncbi:MAG: heme-copper oxidase subunit III [bacterium]